jgi:hypothetical protein
MLINFCNAVTHFLIRKRHMTEIIIDHDLNDNDIFILHEN